MHYLFGDKAIFAGVFFGLAFWFFDYGLIEWRRRRFGYSVSCWILGVSIAALVLTGRWSTGDLVRGGGMGILFYIPLHLWTVKQTR